MRSARLSFNPLISCVIISGVLAGCVSSSQMTRRAPPAPGVTVDPGASNAAALRRELLRMLQAEQEVRARLFVPGTGEVDPSVVPEMQAIDAANRARLKQIISRYGWPTSEWAGRDGVHAAFLIVQHADLEWQKQMLPLIEESVRRGDLEAKNLALLTDRLLVREGRPQRYGTQLTIVNGRVAFNPIEDPDNVDARRAVLGLQSLVEYKRQVEQQLGLSGDPEEGEQPQ